ncbi:MAG TPA: amidohydrolase family protein [Burkholderiaceae bacterium]|nr:amidohydrolase family protein [Burkholderiaceae bacterium]
MSDARLARLKGRIIDFRLRPPTGPYRNFFTPAAVKGVNRLLRQPVPPSYEVGVAGGDGADERAIGVLLKEMDSVGIQVGVMNGRHSVRSNAHIEDADLAAIQAQTQGRLLGLCGVDFDKPVDEVVAGLERGVKELGMKGVCIEPGLARTPMYADDERIFPIYQKVADLGVPLLFMSGPLAGPDISHTDPVRFERVACRWPQMPVILGHGAWPYVNETVALAFKSEITGRCNVYVSPDVYTFAPGGRAYVEGIEFIPNRFVFASSYSFSGVVEAVTKVMALGLSDEVLEQYMVRNAEKLLGISMDR